VLEMIKVIRQRSQIPLVLFTYLNPVYTYGYARFHHDAAAAGADGILVLDLPADEAAQNPELKPTPELRHIRLIAPTTPHDRVPKIAADAEGFIYYVSREGVTGAQTSIATGIAEMVAHIQSTTPVPVCVGFGISTPEQAATVAAMADGVVVGSAFASRLPNQLAFVVPCTTTDRKLPFHPAVRSLDRPSFAMCDQLKSISRQRLIRLHSTQLPRGDIDAIKFVLRQMIDTS